MAPRRSSSTNNSDVKSRQRSSSKSSRKGNNVTPPASSPSSSSSSSSTPSLLKSDSDIWGQDIYTSEAEKIIRTILGPFFLLVITPVFINIAALTALHHGSSFSALWTHYFHSASGSLTTTPTSPISLSSFSSLLADAFPLPSLHLILAVVGFILFQLALFVFLPGRQFHGARAPSGFVPRYTRNGGLAYVITLVTYLIFSSSSSPLTPSLFDPAFIYNHLLPLLTLLNATALIGSVLLFLKAIYAPSTPDHGSTTSSSSSSSFLLRIYWGDELYPSICGVDLKHFIICRLGMMGWTLFTLSFAFASVANHGGNITPDLFASASLNLLYVGKFFLFYEVPGYMSAADIAVDRFGFMLAWGTIAFMPLVHNLHTLHLVSAGTTSSSLGLTWTQSYLWVALGLVMVYLNYDADTLRHRVRALKGKCNVWNDTPVKTIRATYRDASGKTHENLLLVSGYYKLVRHFHYVPDIVLLFLYCAPAGFGSGPLPFTYFFYLTSLLVDRCQRIDSRCLVKYGKAYEEYMQKVPYKLIPGVF